ncbi:N-acetylmuramidase family protein [Paraburkholderia sp. D15]|uniref:N-acetylmuramidase domain-containing protein n=1 Tax=Paraburkholderia sp. D15 TaxID=2880218 RepID=UPI0024799A69|nr:N-acetylmuramidase domain-containing protein [Paraburkholderia sp. D15]WGS51702.1 N-acetylmuramidase family protein [Paraburkholderia sp. D15]
MANAQSNVALASKAKAPPLASVEVTVLFRDVLRKPIEGLSVQLTAGKNTPPAPKWQTGPDPAAVQETPAARNDATTATPASAASAASVAPASSTTVSPSQPASPVAASSPAASPAQTPADTKGASAAAALPPVSDNKTEAVTDKDGFAVTITNAARNQPIDVAVRNRRGEYAWKARIVPRKDVSAFTVVSPEYHLEATTQLTPKDEFEQDLNLPVVKEGEVMTIERLVREFGPYIAWTQKVTEQGRANKDFPKKNREVTVNPKTHKKKTKITIEHHYKVVDTGKPNTVAFNVLGSRLNYPKPEFFSDAQYQHMASELNVEVAAVKAIVQQESQGHPFLENGLPQILYERRHFFELSVKKRDKEDEEKEAKEKVAEKKNTNSAASTKKKATPKKKGPPANPYPKFPDICFPNGDEYGSGGLHQYEKLIRAADLDFEIAIMSCSWGGFQILGEYYRSCGCSTPFEFANKFMSGSDGQAEIFVAFMKNMKSAGVVALREHKWADVAASYNGDGWRNKNPDYADNLKTYYEQFK